MYIPWHIGVPGIHWVNIVWYGIFNEYPLSGGDGSERQTCRNTSYQVIRKYANHCFLSSNWQRPPSGQWGTFIFSLPWEMAYNCFLCSLLIWWTHMMSHMTERPHHALSEASTDQRIETEPCEEKTAPGAEFQFGARPPSSLSLSQTWIKHWNRNQFYWINISCVVWNF